MRWTVQVCTVVPGQVAVISSPRPDSPSQQTNSTSSRPRLRSCASACAHVLAPSPGATQIPSTRLHPSGSMPTARFTALFRTADPSRTFATSASM